MFVRTYVRTYMRPRPTATLRMHERCSNSADLAGFRNQLVLELFVSGPGNVMGAYADVRRDKQSDERQPLILR